MADDADALQIRDLFRKTPVMSMSDLERVVAPRSRRSLFRDLCALGYLSSYTHTGRYYTLRSVPDFDADGLWRYQGIGFSREGTLTATVQRLVEVSDNGRTQRELQLRLGVRVHNPLLDLVLSKQLCRETLDGEYVYLAAERAQAAAQFGRRRPLPAALSLPTLVVEPAIEVEVLLEILHGARLSEPDAARLSAQLAARSVRASIAEVTAVIERHGLKKIPRSRSPRLRR